MDSLTAGREREEIPFFFCCGYAVCYIVIKNGRGGFAEISFSLPVFYNNLT